jgi:septum formation protein
MLNPDTTLILASSSVFRKALLEKLDLPFSCDSPDIDESHKPGETPAQLVQRLAFEKARHVAGKYPGSLVIGSDQVACVDEQILGKPGNFENAMRQLQSASGKAVTFYTGLTLFNAVNGKAQTICDTFKVHFRTLSEAQISRYLKKEQPYNCAGSFKSEGYGISLFSKLEGDDPNALIGLPLIRLITMLENEGFSIP